MSTRRLCPACGVRETQEEACAQCRRRRGGGLSGDKTVPPHYSAWGYLAAAIRGEVPRTWNRETVRAWLAGTRRWECAREIMPEIYEQSLDKSVEHVCRVLREWSDEQKQGYMSSAKIALKASGRPQEARKG